MTETIAEIISMHRARRRTPEETVAQSFARIRAFGDPALFISLRDEAEARAEARALAAQDARDLPLYGVPVAVKDNIDVAGLPTTAACPAFVYQPAADATAVARLPARSLSARPISTSLRPDWSACARPTACHAIRSIRA